MTSNVTVTASTGPGQAVTAQQFTDVDNVQFDFNAGCLYLFQSGTIFKQFSLEGVTTVTVSISGSTYTFTVS